MKDKILAQIKRALTEADAIKKDGFAANPETIYPQVYGYLCGKLKNILEENGIDLER